MLYAKDVNNPLSDLISDDIFNKLYNKGLLNKKSIRNYEIRKKYKKLRNKKISANEAISTLRDDFPHLQFDTVRKIVYNIK
ncbi:MAG: hypothetical protein CR986_08965 [Ignavibacteriae bacterium]|nr:MAG: hypothetical protein CR986_08965 [Ignavibacteriota bacterium]